MKKIIILLIIIFALVGLLVWLLFFNQSTRNYSEQIPYNNEQTPDDETEDGLLTEIIATNLDTPWSIGFLPSGDILITERDGAIRLVDNEGNLKPEPIHDISEVNQISEGGLLGLAVHPDFEQNNYIYLYYSYKDGTIRKNKVVRMKYENESLVNKETIFNNIPGAALHNGGRIKFGPDGHLYITTGDAQRADDAQDVNILAGKILRIRDDGEVVSDNPFDNAVYSYGHRNSQGLAWDDEGNLWATEHGRSGIKSGLDELNLVEKGANYGWPEIEGDENQSGMETPEIHSGPETTWAPAGATYYQDSIFFTGLRGEALYQAILDQEEIEIKVHFKNEFGRLRDVVLGPDNYLYMISNNTDGRGNPDSTDDKLIKVDPDQLR